jgi:hypothetical protein
MFSLCFQARMLCGVFWCHVALCCDVLYGGCVLLCGVSWLDTHMTWSFVVLCAFLWCSMVLCGVVWRCIVFCCVVLHGVLWCHVGLFGVLLCCVIP